MSDLNDDFKLLGELRKQKRAELGPRRLKSAIATLEARGFAVTNHDFDSIIVTKDGFRVHYWPYSGWFQGTIRGRGIMNLIRKAGL